MLTIEQQMTAGSLRNLCETKADCLRGSGYRHDCSCALCCQRRVVRIPCGSDQTTFRRRDPQTKRLSGTSVDQGYSGNPRRRRLYCFGAVMQCVLQNRWPRHRRWASRRARFGTALGIIFGGGVVQSDSATAAIAISNPYIVTLCAFACGSLSTW